MPLPRLPSVPLLALLLATSLALTACNSPRVPPTARGEALQDGGIREVKVVKVWDQSTDRIDSEGDPHVSHYIEVDVLNGTGAGGQLTLPYDEWNVGKAPPPRGTVLLIAPQDWVKRDPRSQGRPVFGDR